MRDDKFKRIVKAIYQNRDLNLKDIKSFRKVFDEYRKQEDAKFFLRFCDKKIEIVDKDWFEKFVCDYLGISDIKNFDRKVYSKKESVEVYGDSKKKNLHTSDLIVVLREKYKNPIIYCNDFPEIKKVVAIENFESFLKVDFSRFKEEWFVYLGGEANKKVREFLKDKEVLFFVDFDFEGIDIFENFKCRKKELYLPENIEELIKNSNNQQLYLDQKQTGNRLKLTNTNAKKLYDIINKYARVIEQEILDEDKRCN
jgi:hypothetical protein